MTEAQKFDRFHADVEVQTGEVLAMLENMLSSKLVEKKDVRKIITKVTRAVRTTVAREYLKSVRAGKNRRMAQRAVKMAVWKKSLGSSVSLYSAKKGDTRELDDDIYQPAHRYNPRRLRLPRTKQIQKAYGKDASFILRWVNSGTGTRRTGGRHSYYMGQRRGCAKNIETSKYFKLAADEHDNLTSVNRGSIKARNFFDVAPRAMDNAADELAKQILSIMENISNE